jgi:hypothetical protein
MVRPAFLRWIILAPMWNYEDKKNREGHYDQHGINSVTTQLILAIEAVLEESTQQKIGLVKQEANSRNTLNVRN